MRGIEKLMHTTKIQQRLRCTKVTTAAKTKRNASRYMLSLAALFSASSSSSSLKNIVIKDVL